MTFTGLNGAQYRTDPNKIKDTAGGAVYRIPGSAPEMAAVIYDDSNRTPGLEARLKAVINRQPDAGVLSVLPLDILYDNNARFCGFIISMLDINGDYDYIKPPALNNKRSSAEFIIIAAVLVIAIAAVAYGAANGWFTRDESQTAADIQGPVQQPAADIQQPVQQPAADIQQPAQDPAPQPLQDPAPESIQPPAQDPIPTQQPIQPLIQDPIPQPLQDPIPPAPGNTTPQTASPVAAGGAINGVFSSESADAWHYIDISSYGLLDIYFNRDQTLRSSVYLYASDTNTIINSSDTAGFSSALQPGRYYIKIGYTSGGGSYSASITFDAQTAANHRQRGDNTSRGANHSQLNSSNYGYIGYYSAANGAIDREAWYYVDIYSDGVLNIDYAHDPYLRSTVYLYTTNAAIVIDNEQNRGFSAPVKPGKYYIKINQDSGYGAYTMSTSFTAQTAVNNRYPGDDTPHGAGNALFNAVNRGHLGYIFADSGQPDREVWYFADVLFDGIMSIDMIQDVMLYTVVYIYESDANTLIKHEENTTGFDVPVTPGRYYIRIKQDTGYGAYSMSVTVNNP